MYYLGFRWDIYTIWVRLFILVDQYQQQAINIRIGKMSLEDSKSRTRYHSTKYKTIKTNPNHTTIKRVQKLYTQLPLQSSANVLHSKCSIQRPSNNVNKLSISFSSNPIAGDYQPILNKAKQKLYSNYNKNHPPPATKEQLYQENLHLKAMLNELKQTLTKQKIQTELQKKKNKKYTSVLNREFKKEMYYQPKLGYVGEPTADDDTRKQEEKVIKMYSADDSDENPPEKESTPYSQLLSVPTRQNNNYKHYKMLLKANPAETSAHSLSYMITGIKQKYQELKVEHEKILKELEKYKSMDIFKKLQEVSIYCTVLEEDNKKLAASLNSSKIKLASYEESKPSRNQDQYQSSAIPELTHQVQSIKAKNLKLRQENKKVKQQQRENMKLIEYLESIIIEKDNFQNKSIKTMKKINIILDQMEQELKQEKQQNRHLKQVYQREKQQLTRNFQEQAAHKKDVFEQALFEKNSEIKKLQKQMSYLTTIIENWKLGEDAKANNSSGQGTARRRKESTITGRQIGSLKLPENPENITNPLSKISERRELQKEYQSKVHQIASLSNRNFPQDDNQIKINGQKKQNNTKNKTERKRKTSSVKRSENSKKLRKVNVEQITDLPEYLRYRLIGSNISLEQACKLLNYRPLREPNEESNLNNEEGQDDRKQIEEQQKWKQNYINQAQLTAIFIQDPFKLKTEEALLLARYIVEDELIYENGDKTNGFVYSDFQNQIERSFAKSILKAFLQTHSTNFLQVADKSQFHSCEQEWKKILEKHGPRISTPLLSIASSGFISKDRWNELLSSVSGQIGENVREWCVGRMLVQSQNLGKLRYRVIVPDSV